MSKRLAIATVPLAVTMCACANGARDEGQSTAQEPPAATVQSRVMPDVVGSTLSEAVTAIAPLGNPVVLAFPALEATRLVEAEYIAGSLVPEHSQKVSLPERRRSTQGASSLKHPVASQDVTPGVIVSRDSTITLTAGAHPGSGPTPWIIGHWQAVKKRGAQACFECHDPTGCSNCHTTLE